MWWIRNRDWMSCETSLELVSVDATVVRSRDLENQGRRWIRESAGTGSHRRARAAGPDGEGTETPVDGGRPNRGPVMLAERVRNVRNGKSDFWPKMRCGLVSRGRKADF